MEKKENKKAISVEQKLRALYKIQLIDSEIDKLRVIRGELPLQIEDLKDNIEGFNIRVEKLKNEISFIKHNIHDKQNQILESNEKIKKYEDQQNNIRNNREFESLKKEIEFQTLEVQILEKKIKEDNFTIEKKEELLAQIEEKLEDKKNDLEHKELELDKIVKGTEKEEKRLLKLSSEAQKKVEERLLKAYHKIRNKVKNGLAIVPIERDSAGGSFLQIPPQRIIDISLRKKIIIDEHSGRILIDEDLANEEIENLKKVLKISN